MNLTIKVVEEVKSSNLCGILTAIAARLMDALRGQFLKKVWERGYDLAVRLARLAHSWGNVKALSWIKDKAYILYLGFSSLNTLSSVGDFR